MTNFIEKYTPEWLTKNPKRMWLILATIALSFSGILAVEISLARAPMFAEFFSPGSFYRALGVHVVFSIIIWLFLCAICLWNEYLPEVKHKLDGLVFVAIFISMILLGLVGFFNWGQPYLNDYVPVVHHPLYWIGMTLFISSFLFVLKKYMPHTHKLMNKHSEGQLVFYSFLIVVVMMVSMVIAAGVTEMGADLRIYFQHLFWVPGHIQQFLNACLLLLAMHYLVRKSNPKFTVDGMKNNVWLKVANLLLLVSIFPMFGGFFIAPALPSFRYMMVFVFGIGLGVPILIHTVYLIGKVKPGNFAGGIFLFAILLYYSGVLIAYGGMQSDLRVTAHYHGVLASLTVSLMGVTYFILEKYNVLKHSRIVRIQPAIFTAGMMVFIICLFLAGHYGAPRKTFGFEWVISNTMFSYLNILGIGALLSISAGILFIILCLRSLISFPFSIAKLKLLLLFLPFTLMSFDLPDESRFIGKEIIDVPVFNEHGDTLMLWEIIRQKPVVFSPVYTRCPHTCSVITSNLKQSLEGVRGLGDDYQVVSLSFDTADRPANLRQFRERHDLPESSWSVVSTGHEEITALLASMDFQIVWNETFKQYDHPNVLVILTPSSRISRYIYGVTPSKRNIRISILEAKQEQTGLSFYEGFILRCFTYNTETKSFHFDKELFAHIITSGTVILAMIGYLVKSTFFS